MGGLGSLLGPLRAILGRSWASVGGLGPLLRPLLAILDRSWDLCWRSWAEKWPKPEREGDLASGPGSKSGGAGEVPEIDCFGRRALLRIFYVIYIYTRRRGSGVFGFGGFGLGICGLSRHRRARVHARVHDDTHRREAAGIKEKNTATGKPPRIL